MHTVRDSSPQQMASVDNQGASAKGIRFPKATAQVSFGLRYSFCCYLSRNVLTDTITAWCQLTEEEEVSVCLCVFLHELIPLSLFIGTFT